MKEEVMIFAERVGDTQRMAVREMKDLHEKRRDTGATLRLKRIGKRSRVDMDKDEG
jgi:ATP-dependent RNA helicase DDX47/RRP3